MRPECAAKMAFDFKPSVCLDNGTPFVVVSYYTMGSDYEALASRLEKSCRQHGLDLYIFGIRSLGSWKSNIRRRPSFLLDIWEICPRNIVWIDADAVVRSRPEIFFSLDRRKFDVAIHKNKRGKYRVGTMWIANSDVGRLFLEVWAEATRRKPNETEQESLNRIIQRPRNPWKIFDLPATYCSIFDKREDRAAGPAVIEHFQASRKNRRRMI